METMMMVGWVGVMLLVGMALRSKVRFLRNALVPSSVLAGLVGFVLMNTTGLLLVQPARLTGLVSQLFTVSFISIGLTGTAKKTTIGGTDSAGRSIVQGSLGMGLTWVLLYAVTAVVGGLCVALAGRLCGMDPVYGLMAPFAFAQGPGQSATFGAIMEGYGWPDAAMVGVTFSAIGFIAAFAVGVPLAKAGLRRGIPCNSAKIDEAMARGYFKPGEQTPKAGTVTCHSGNIDPLAFHVALVGLTYVLTYVVTSLLAKLIGPLGDTLRGMMFMMGMLCGYLVKALMKRLKIDYIHDNETQKRITGFATDFLVASSFMAVQVRVVGRWMVPILFASLVVCVLTYFVCMYFGRRFGGRNDFERTLGLWGTSTGTVPSGIGLVRIVDPDLSTTTAVELGAMNIPMMASAVSVTGILAIAAGKLSLPLGYLVLLAPVPVYLVLMKVFRVWGKPTYTLGANNNAGPLPVKKEQ